MQNTHCAINHRAISRTKFHSFIPTISTYLLFLFGASSSTAYLKCICIASFCIM